MARPKKQTIEYFPHFVSSGKTIFILENEFGNDGYAFWFKLLETLGSTEGHVYDTGNPADLRFLIAKTRVSGEVMTKILDMLAELGAIDSELWSEKIIWVQNLVDNVADVYAKRKCELPQKPSLCYPKPELNGIDGEFTEQKPELSGVSDNINPQSKVKESKVKESKVKNTTTITSSRENGSSDDLEILSIASKRNLILSPIQQEQILEDVKIFSFEEVTKALEIADDNGKRTYGYVRGILQKRRADSSGNGGHSKKYNIEIPTECHLTDEEREAAKDLI